MQTQKPTLVNVIAWSTLGSGILNLVWGLGAAGAALASVIGIFCVPIAILPTALGIFEIIYAAKLLSNPPQVVQPSTTIAILEVVCIVVGNVFAMVVGILSLVFYNDQIVRDYFARLNGNVPPEPVPAIPPVTPPPPVPPVDPVPYPVAAEPPVPPEEPIFPDPQTPEDPEKPER